MNNNTYDNKTIPMCDYGNMVQHTVKNKLRKTVAMYPNPYYNICIIGPIDRSIKSTKYVRQYEGVHYEQNNN